MKSTSRNLRSAIYPKDVAIITGKSSKSASRIIAKIRSDLGKEPNILTVKEFCNYPRLNLDDILDTLNL
jgi:hypothetical protein